MNGIKYGTRVRRMFHDGTASSKSIDKKCSSTLLTTLLFVAWLAGRCYFILRRKTMYNTITWCDSFRYSEKVVLVSLNELELGYLFRCHGPTQFRELRPKSFDCPVDKPAVHVVGKLGIGIIAPPH